ncbi:MAG: hypothetical protein WCG80_05830 [Spirochaetales bacterium]
MTLRALVGLASLLLLGSCAEITHFLGLDIDYFADYRGKNLLDSSGFEAVDSTGAAKWSLEVPVDYMRFEVPTETSVPVTYVEATTSTSYPVYRLEIRNLIPDGDFEEEAAGASSFAHSFWSLKQSGPTANNLVFGTSFLTLGSITLVGDPRSLDHNAFWWDANATGNRLQLDLKQALGTLWTAAAYRLRFDLINLTPGSGFDLFLMAGTTTLLSQVTDAQDGGSWQLTSTPTDQTTRISVSKTFTLDSTAPQRIVNFGNYDPASPTSNKAIIDNVRLLPADKLLSVGLKLAKLTSIDPAGLLALLPGSKPGAYTLTLAVRDDPSSDPTSANHALNRFYPQGLTVVLAAQVKSGTGSYRQFFPRPAGGWSDWTTLELPVGFDFVTTDPTDGSPVLSIAFSPTDFFGNTLGGRDVGSLLIAHPTLTFNP